ncbi:hypothetical protein G9A89_013331 [Geosiphon pyriformis]|nr:hypothetical protein G9A89_013331 [Geosiphon pyriformis]
MPPFYLNPAATISGSSVKRRSARVSTTGSVGGGSGHKFKKPPGGAKLSNSGTTLERGGSGCMVGQFNGMDTDGEVSEGEEVPDSKINTMEKAMSLARGNNIVVNSDLKKQGVHSDQAIVIKEIPMNTSKEMIVTTVSEFGQYKALLFILPVETTAHDLGDLLADAGGKTCIINRLLNTGNRVCCAVVCFENDKALESVFCTKPIFGGVKLSWVRLDLIWCDRCGKLGYSVLECDDESISVPKPLKPFIKWVASDENRLQLAKLYAKKSVPISCPAAFGGKSWAQVISSVFVSSGLFTGSGLSLFFSNGPGSGSLPPPTFALDSALDGQLLFLE